MRRAGSAAIILTLATAAAWALPSMLSASSERDLRAVLVHSRGVTLKPQLDYHRTCASPPRCFAYYVDYAGQTRVRFLPVRGARPVVVRTRLRADSVTLRLFDEEGRRVASVDLDSLGAPGRVWRERLPRGIGRARQATLVVDYTHTHAPDGSPRGETRYSLYVCPLRRGCAQPER